MTDSDALSVAQVRELLAAADGRQLARLLTRFGEDTRAGVRTAVASARAKAAAARVELARTRRLYALECELRQQGFCLVAGVDEVGRGALAGPLTAAAVVLRDSPLVKGLDDSKRLSPARREVLADMIHREAVAVGLAHVSPSEIDALGMTCAMRRVVGRAISQLGLQVDHVVLDGLPLRVADSETAVVKGDQKVAAVAAASIVAKVARDALMRSLAREYPKYGFDINKGYGTSQHLSAIARDGLTPAHRRSFSIGGGTGTLF